MGKMIRLDRFLTDMGLGTRSQIKDMAKRGRIQVNGVTVKKTEEKIDPKSDIVLCDGKKVAYARTEYYMLNKPQGTVSATEDNLHKTVLDLIMNSPPKVSEAGKFQADECSECSADREGRPRRKDLFPVGRLDIDTEGLILITNDGELAHSLLSPRHHVDKQYFARVAGVLPEDAEERFGQGITLLDGTKLLPAKLEILEEAGGDKRENRELREVILTIREGKFHQVKRMFEALGCRVVFLKRLSMGSLVLDENLRPGEYRPLSEREVEELKSDGGRQGRGKYIESKREYESAGFQYGLCLDKREKESKTSDQRPGNIEPGEE